MKDRHDNTPSYEYHVEPVAHVCEVVDDADVAHLGKLVYQGVCDAQEYYEIHPGVVLLRMRINILSHGIHKQKAKVDQVDCCTN